MKSGLYALAGASATATAAACANRLDWPMTKLSNAYFGLRRVSRAETGVVFSKTDCGEARSSTGSLRSSTKEAWGSGARSSSSSGLTTT